MVEGVPAGTKKGGTTLALDRSSAGEPVELGKKEGPWPWPSMDGWRAG